MLRTTARWPKATEQAEASRRGLSDGELLTALAAPCGKDGAASTGTHPLAETVHLRPSAVVRLERALAHWDSRSFGKLSSIKGRHVVHRAFELCVQDVGLQTWLSLLTVRVIHALVKPSGRAAQNTAISTTYLPSET
jgi:hypothetical protein